MAPRDTPFGINRLDKLPTDDDIHAQIDREIHDDRIEELTGKRPYHFKMPRIDWEEAVPVLVVVGAVGLLGLLFLILPPCGG